jgi:CRP-like cAMP-binding protein
MEDLKSIISEHPFFTGMAPAYLETIVGCAANARFNAGDFLFREGREAQSFFLVRHGTVALEIYTPSQGPLQIETIEAGDVLGWAWLFPPYRWHFDARALELTRVIAMDGKCLRQKAEKDEKLGYVLMKRFAGIMQERLDAARLQLADIYNNPVASHKAKSV